MFEIPESIPHLVWHHCSFLLQNLGLYHWRTILQGSKLFDQHLNIEGVEEDWLPVRALVEVEHGLGLVTLVTRLRLDCGDVQVCHSHTFINHLGDILARAHTVTPHSTHVTRTRLSDHILASKWVHNSCWTGRRSNCQGLETRNSGLWFSWRCFLSNFWSHHRLHLPLIKKFESFLNKTRLWLVFLLFPLFLQISPLLVKNLSFNLLRISSKHLDIVSVHTHVVEVRIVRQEAVGDRNSKDRVPLPLHQGHIDALPRPVVVLGHDLDGLEPGLGDGLVTDGAGPAGVVRQGEVVEDARVAEHVATLRHLPCRGRKQANGTRGLFTAAHSQQNLFNKVPVDQDVGVGGLDGVVLPRLHDELTVGLQVVGVVVLGPGQVLAVLLTIVLLSLVVVGAGSGDPVTVLKVQQMVVVLLLASRVEY